MYVIILQNNGKHCNLSNYIFHTSSLKNVLAILFISMVAYFCHHLSDNYVDLSDNYVDLSDHYVDLSEKYHHN